MAEDPSSSLDILRQQQQQDYDDDEQAQSSTILPISESSEDSNDSDAPSQRTRPLESHSKQVEDDSEEPPYPPFNIWNMPRGARIPIESYKEMTLACRFVPTDQWLTTRVDRAWTVAQVKHHMLTKVWGGRRYQLSLPRNLSHTTKPGGEATAKGAAGTGAIGNGGNGKAEDGSRRMSISSSNYSSVVFATSVQGDNYPRSHYTFDTVINASSASLSQQSTSPSTASSASSAGLPGTPDGGRTPTPRLMRSHSSTDLASAATAASSSQQQQQQPQSPGRPSSSRGRPRSASASRNRAQSVSSGQRRPPSNRSDSIIRDLRREEAMDRLYERMEANVKRRVLKAAKGYRVVSFSNGNVLDDKDLLSVYGLKPYELLEIQPVTQCIRLARPTYLEPYFETDTMVRVRTSEKHGVEFLKRLRQLHQEEKAKAELTKAMSALGMDDEQNRPGNEWGTGLSAVTKQRNLEERKEEEKRRILLEQARKESEKRAKREKREQESEKWKYRKMIVEGHDLNLWRDHLHDAFPEQSWDLRRVVEVQIPRPKKPPVAPLSSAQSGYAAIAFSSNLQSVSTRAPDKGKAPEKDAKDEVLEQPTLHIRFSIPLASVHASLNPAAAAAIHAARLKRAAKANPGSTYLAESLASLGAASTRRLDSTDPYNQGIGFGTSTLEGAGTASLVLRLPNERTREHLCRIIHRSAGKYPLATKNRRKLAFEPVADLIHVPDPDPDRTQEHGAPFPEWRARILKKSIAAGRAGFLSSSAWGAVFNQETGLYCRPERPQAANDKGKGPALPYGDDAADGYEGDEDDDCASLASDTEWEGWRRELEMDMPIKHLPTILSNSNSTSTATPMAAHSITTIREDPSSSAIGNLSAVAAENIARSDEEARLLTPIQRRNPPPLARKSSLQLAKRIVVEGTAGKGLIMPRTKAYASWTSFSSNSSVNSSFFSHEEYRSGEGSDTTANRKPRLAPLVTSSARATTGSLSRAKSATLFSSNVNITVPRVSLSAPLSAAMDPRDAVWKPGSAAPAPIASTSAYVQPADEVYEEFPELGPDVVLPGLGGGLGNPGMFPAFAGGGTTVTTITSGRQINGRKKSKSGSGWLSKSFSRGSEDASEGATSSGFGSLSRRSSNSNIASIVRSISKRER